MHDSRVFAYKEIIKASAPPARVSHLRVFRRWRLLLLTGARTCWRSAPCVALFRAAVAPLARGRAWSVRVGARSGVRRGSPLPALSRSPALPSSRLFSLLRLAVRCGGASLRCGALRGKMYRFLMRKGLVGLLSPLRLRLAVACAFRRASLLCRGLFPPPFSVCRAWRCRNPDRHPKAPFGAPALARR